MKPSVSTTMHARLAATKSESTGCTSSTKLTSITTAATRKTERYTSSVSMRYSSKLENESSKTHTFAPPASMPSSRSRMSTIASAFPPWSILM